MGREDGFFESVKELNEAAAILREKRDADALLELAEANGLDAEDAEDYLDGVVPELANAYMAAVGRIKVEKNKLQINGILEDWTGYIISLCEGDDEMCAAVMRSKKSLAGCMSELIRFSFEHKVQICETIVDVTKISHNGKEEPLRGPLYMGIPNKAECKKIIRDYYLGQEV